MSSPTLRHLLSTAALLLAACGGDSLPTTPPPPPPPPPPPATAPVATVAVNPAALNVVAGRTGPLTAVLRDSVGNELSGRTIIWASNTPAVATVNSSGVVTAVSLGTAAISATSEGKSAQSAITVVPIPVGSVTVAQDTTSLKVANTRTYVAVVKDDLGTVLTDRTVRWSTSDKLIATIDSATGVVTGEDDGTANITAAVEGKTGTAPLRVYSPVASVTVTLPLDTLEAYDTRQMQVTLRNAKGKVLTGRQISWVVSNVAVATLDQVGLLTGVDRGTVIVTATSEGIAGTVKRVVVIKYRSLSVGTMHACNLASGGIAWCWGLNGRYGALGMPSLGDAVTSAIPVKVPGDHRFVQLSTYGRHACALKANGAAYCWGNNGIGELGAPVGAVSATPVAVSGGIAFKQISTGGDHSCGLDLGGRAYCWGQNQLGALGDGSTINRSVPTRVDGGLSFASISTGSGSTCAVANDGATFCWGGNSLGQLGAGGPLGGTSTIPVRVAGGLAASQVGVGQAYACALTAGGQGFCWGGQKASGAPVQTSTPLPMAGGQSFRMLSAGATHGCGVNTANDVYCWGANASGKLGVPGNGTSLPVLAGNGLKAIEVAAAGVATGSGAHTCAVSPDRLTVYCWGQNDVGQLGNGAFTPQSVVNATPSIVVSQKPLPPS